MSNVIISLAFGADFRIFKQLEFGPHLATLRAEGVTQ